MESSMRGRQAGAQTHTESSKRGRQAGEQTHMESSMRGRQVGEQTHMESSMRGRQAGAQTHMESSMRGRQAGAQTHTESSKRGRQAGEQTHMESSMGGRQVGTQMHRNSVHVYKCTRKAACEATYTRTCAGINVRRKVYMYACLQGKQHAKFARLLETCAHRAWKPRHAGYMYVENLTLVGVGLAIPFIYTHCI